MIERRRRMKATSSARDSVGERNSGGIVSGFAELSVLLICSISLVPASTEAPQYQDETKRLAGHDGCPNTHRALPNKRSVGCSWRGPASTAGTTVIEDGRKIGRQSAPTDACWNCLTEIDRIFRKLGRARKLIKEA